MINNPAMTELLNKEKRKIVEEQTLNYKNCIWYYTKLIWGKELEIIISRNDQEIADYLEQFDELNYYNKAKPLPPDGAGEGIKPHQQIHQFTAGSKRGPQRWTILKIAGLSKNKRYKIKIINLDSRGLGF